jgi:hypothetical protein
MPLNLASPGIVVREVDLTLGRTQPASDKIGAIVAPFAKGPVDLPILIQNENELLNNFGEPYSIDKHYEHWLSASSYLAYGGALRVVRANDNTLRNGFVGTATSVKIDSLDHYISLGYDDNTLTGVTIAAKNPGSWSNGIKVAIIVVAGIILLWAESIPKVKGVAEALNKIKQFLTEGKKNA